MSKKSLKWVVAIVLPLLLIMPFGWKWNFFKSCILHPSKTGITTLNFYDESRERPVVTEVWYPVDQSVPAKSAAGFWVRCDEARDAAISTQKKKYPLVIISHGNGADRFTISWLAEILAANGYIVAAMDHYGNTWNNKIPECYTRPWERPKDITFVIDQMLENPRFADKIDQKRIGFAGYSLGGATGIWVAGAVARAISDEELITACKKDLSHVVSHAVIEQTNFNEARESFADKRVSAFLLMAPALGWLFDESSLETVSSPVYIYGAEKDKEAPVETNAKLFAKKISKATLKIFPGDCDHYIFINNASQLGKRLLDPKLHEDRSTLGRNKIHEDIGKNAIDFFASHLSR